MGGGGCQAVGGKDRRGGGWAGERGGGQMGGRGYDRDGGGGRGCPAGERGAAAALEGWPRVAWPDARVAKAAWRNTGPNALSAETGDPAPVSNGVDMRREAEKRSVFPLGPAPAAHGPHVGGNGHKSRCESTGRVRPTADWSVAALLYPAGARRRAHRARPGAPRAHAGPLPPVHPRARSALPPRRRPLARSQHAQPPRQRPRCASRNGIFGLTER